MSSLSPGGTLALGVIVGLLSTCVQSVGLTLQRKSHMLEDEKEDDTPRRAPYRRRRWQIGMFLFLLSNIVGSSIQITTLPLPLLSTLQASGLVFNALMATLLLDESFTIRTAIGTVLVAAGAVLISSFSAVPEPSHNLDQLLSLLVVPNFIVWMSLTLALVAVVLVATFCLNHFLPQHARDRARVRLLKGMCFGLVSGVLSAHALLLAKSAVELLVRTIVDHRNQFNRYQSWLLLLLFLFLALTQLYYLHLGLKLVTTSLLYPFVFCIYNIVAILDGLIYFRQTDRLAPLHAGLIALGTAILLSGVLALSWRLSEEEEETAGIHNHVYASDIPPSALAPGMGFVDDDPSANDDLLDFAPGQDGADAERAPLISRFGHRRRHTLRDASLAIGRKRRRSNTIRERAGIWDELLNDDEESYYGTTSRPQSRQSLPLQQQYRCQQHSHRPSDESVTLRQVSRPSRAKTMSSADTKILRPASEEILSLTRDDVEDRPSRDRDSLTRNMIHWWRSRWKSGGGDDDDDDDDDSDDDNGDGNTQQRERRLAE